MTIVNLFIQITAMLYFYQPESVSYVDVKRYEHAAASELQSYA